MTSPNPPSPNPKETLRFAVAGVAGRMGQACLRAVVQSPRAKLVGASIKPRHPLMKSDAALIAGLPPVGLLPCDNPQLALSNADVLLDFTSPEHSLELAAVTQRMRVAHVVGTTGFSDDQRQKLRELSQERPIVVSGNMSRGFHALAHIASLAAKILPDWDVEILDIHHRYKKDAPSGSSFILADAVDKGRRNASTRLPQIRSLNKNLPQRPLGAVGFASMRAGDVIGEHTLVMAHNNERLSFTHVAQSRDIFAHGALTLAFILHSQPNGEHDVAALFAKDFAQDESK